VERFGERDRQKADAKKALEKQVASAVLSGHMQMHHHGALCAAIDAAPGNSVSMSANGHDGLSGSISLSITGWTQEDA
jgi:hydroxymethylglutaryl-CoA reductase